MSALLNIFNLGSKGVNVDKNPLQLEDGELTKAQNAINGSRIDASVEGSLQKRPGLVKVNGSAAAGAIKGAVGVPIGQGTAGNDIPAVDPATRLLLVARHITSTTSGWNTSTDSWITSPTTGGPDGYDANGTPRVPDYHWDNVEFSGDSTFAKTRALWSGRPGCTFQNRLYYAGNDYTNGTTNPTVRMFDGSVDYLLGRIPSRQGTVTQAILDMIVGGDDMIYFTTLDTGTYAANSMKGRVFQLDPETGVIVQLGSLFPYSAETIRIPFTLCWHAGRLWTRTFGAGITSNSHLVYYIRPGIDSDWTADTSSEATPANCNVMHSFQGQLFMGTVADQTVAATMRVRSTQAAYSTSHTVTLIQSGVQTMGAFGYQNGFGAMATFGGNLYASYWNAEGAANDNSGSKWMRIYKFDGTNWSAVYGPTADHADNVPYTHAFVTGGRLYFVSAPARTNANTINRLLYTPDGTNFSSITSTLLDNASGGFMSAIAT